MQKKRDLSRIKAVAHGLKYESVARDLYRKETKNETREVGLYISRTHSYIVASPDGIFFDSSRKIFGTLELKAPFSVRNCTIEEALKKLRYIDRNGKLKRNSDYFFQIQTQMFCSGLKLSHFVVYTFKGLHVEQIEFDDIFWNTTVLPKINEFHQKWYVGLNTPVTMSPSIG